MIAKPFEDFLLKHLEHYLIPADELAIFIDTHNADHVMLVSQKTRFTWGRLV